MRGLPVTKIVDKLLNPTDEKWIQAILDRDRREADAAEIEEANNSYYNDPLGSG